MANDANIEKYKQLVAERRISDEPLKLAHAIRHLGDAYYYAGEIKLSEPYYVEALSIYRGHDNPRTLDLANAVRSFAVIKAELGADDEAIDPWQEAHDLYRSVNVLAGVAGSAAHLALLAQHKNDVQESLHWLDEAIKTAEIAEDPEVSQFVASVKVQLDNSLTNLP